ncbi:MAG: hypothetical protein RTU30_00675 [Candidatus Thorarchaeota archaeon]
MTSTATIECVPCGLTFDSEDEKADHVKTKHRPKTSAQKGNDWANKMGV